MALNYKSSIARYRRYLQSAAQKPLWKASLFLSLSLILVVGLLVVAIRPTAVKIAELNGKIKVQRELTIKLNDKIVADQKAAALLEQFKLRLESLNEGLPIEPKWKEWETNMEAVATKSGVNVTAVNIGGIQIKGERIPSPTENAAAGAIKLPAEVTGISVNVEATGDYSQLVSFADDLEKTRRIIMLSDVEINKDTDGKLKLMIAGKIGYTEKFLNI